MTSSAELKISRVFAAPIDLVFQAFVEADHLVNWWGPVGADVHIETLDASPGGMFHYCLSVPDVGEMWGKLAFREIVPPERIVYISSFSDAAGNVVRAPFSDRFPLKVLNILTFTEEGGQTRVALHAEPIESTDAEREMFDSMVGSMEQGFGGTFDQLNDYLTQIQGE